MKSNKLPQVLLILLTALSLSVPAMAQEEIDQLFNESVNDTEKIIGAYISPFMTSVSSGLNQGWYNTAKPHKVGGVDLTLTVNFMSIPKDELSFRPNDLGLESLELRDYSAQSPEAPTIFGSEVNPTYGAQDDPTGTTDFEGPGGLDIKNTLPLGSMPVPMYNLGVGLPKGFDVKLRFVPTLDLADQAQFSLFGIGVMHDIKQWMPGIKKLPFDLSGFIGYTRLSMTSAIEGDNIENGVAEVAMNALTIQGVISKKISVLTVYGGAGYNIARSSLDVKGNFDFNQDNDFSDDREVDPFGLKFGASGPRMTAGFRVKLAVITLHFDYTLQRYSCFTGGFGISIR